MRATGLSFLLAQRAGSEAARRTRAVERQPDSRIGGGNSEKKVMGRNVRPSGLQQGEPLTRFTPASNHGMFSARQGVISLKEQKPVCC